MMLFMMACMQVGLIPNPEYSEVTADGELEFTPPSENSVEEEVDSDGDGYSIANGDCVDSDANIFPGQIDICDGVDNDCDEIIDEDANEDSWEPNDSYAYFGGQFDGPDTLEFEGILSTTADVDRFQWYMTDPIGGFFQINVLLEGISIDTDYIVELWLIEDFQGNPGGLLQTVNNGSYGEQENIEQGGVPFYDDAGLYEVVVYAFDGGGCDANYNLEIGFTN